MNVYLKLKPRESMPEQQSLVLRSFTCGHELRLAVTVIYGSKHTRLKGNFSSMSY